MHESSRIMVVGEQWFGATPRGVAEGLRRLGHEVETVDPRDTVLAASGVVLKAVRRALLPLLVRDYNRKLRQVAERFRPDIVLVVKGPYVQRGTLHVWRNLGARLYNYYPDVSIRAFGKHIPGAIPEYDHIFTTKSFQVGALKVWLGADRVTFLPHGYSPDVHRPVCLADRDRDRYETDIGYIGNYSPFKEQWLADVRRRLPDVKFAVRGNHWLERCRRSELRDCIVGGAVPGLAYSKVIVAAKVNIAIHHGEVLAEGVADLMSTRSFEIPACGGFMLHERNDETEEYFVDGKEVALFSGIDEAVEKIRYYLDHATERESVACAGYARCVPAYSYDSRMQTLMEVHEGMAEACVG
jgi:spore maturation protein CgeB